MKRMIIFAFLVISILVLFGCAEKEEGSVCNKPYFEYMKGQCCLDSNNNQICDTDEIQKEEKVTEEGSEKDKQIEKPEAGDVVTDAMRKVVKIKTNYVQGSGFFIDSEGYIVTNYHVIQGLYPEYDLKYLTIYTPNKKEYKNLEIAGYNYDYDIALLKIKDNGTFNHLNFGNSDALKTGDRVYALGTPEGLDFSASSGIISAKKRSGYYNQDVKNYLQTDSAINSGNSGGPLINEAGEVVGLNTFGYAPWYAEGLNFALESNKMKQLVESMKYTSKYLMVTSSDDFYQTKPNKKVEAFNIGKFNVKSIVTQEQDPVTWKLYNVYGTVFHDFGVSLYNTDDIAHNICFDVKVMKEGIKELSKRLDTKFTLNPKQRLTETITVSHRSGGGRDCYFEVKIVDCDTNEVFNEAFMRKYYTPNI